MAAIAAWVEEAVGATDCGDQRRRRRLLQTVTTLAGQPGAALSQASADWAECLAIYRLWQNPRLEVAALIQSIGAASGERCRGCDLLLLVQDTTDIEPHAQARCQGLGPLGSGAPQGLKLHTTLVVTPDGLPLGIGHQQSWRRDPETVGTRHQRYHTPIEGKESRKWLIGMQEAARHLPAETTPVTVADREADVYELYALHDQLGGAFVVRAARDRRLAGPAADAPAYLFATLAQAPCRGQVTVRVPRADGRHERQATVTLRSDQVTVQPPNYVSYAKARREWWQAHPTVTPLLERPLEPLVLGAVEVREEQPPKGVEALHWRLLTSLPVSTLAAAEQVVAYYRQRWVVERFHYVLKAGCRVEQLQLEQAERLERAVVTYSLVAWRLLWLTLQARRTPTVSCETVVPPACWQAAYVSVHRHTQVPEQAPSLAEFVSLVGRLGGHLGRARDGPPGVKTLWRGLRELNRLADLWTLLHPDPT